MTATRPVYHTPRHPQQPSKLDGVRPDKSFRREGAAPARDELGNATLMQAAAWVHTRRAHRHRVAWTERDQRTTDEVRARSWGFGELQMLAVWLIPSWFSLLELPQRAEGYLRFLAMLLAAYRAGAVGVELSYEEGMSMCHVRSRATWRKWTAELERAGLIRIVQLWRIGDDGKPCYARLHYRIGPELERVGGPGLCEGVASPVGPSAAWCSRVAQGLRRRARAVRRERKAAAWQSCRPSSAEPSKDCGDRELDQAAQAPSQPLAEAGTGAVAVELVDVGTSSSTSSAEPSALDDDGRGDQARTPAAGAGVPDADPGSLVNALHSAALPGADKRARRRPVGKVRARAELGAPTASPRPSSSSALGSADDVDELVPTSTSSTATAPVPATVGDDGGSGSGHRELAGVELLRGWLDANRPTSARHRGARADAARELVRSVTAARDSKSRVSSSLCQNENRERDELDERAAVCSRCGGAGGVYDTHDEHGRRIQRTAKENEGPSWAPVRGVELGRWRPCDDCGGSGEAPS